MVTNPLLKFIWKMFASVGGLGYLPASGTWGSAAAAAGLWFSQAKFESWHISTTASSYWLLVLAAIAVSFLFSSGSRQIFGKEDSGRIVIDEVAGQLVTFLFIPLTLKTLILGFVLFRFFDIIKPWPVHNMEGLDDGVGVTMDDVAAGVYANLSLMAILFSYHVVKAYL